MSWCWWCCHPFDGDVHHMPYHYDEKRKKFKTTGIFCSFSCIKAYALDKYGITKGGLLCSNLSLYKKHLTGKLEVTKCAPNRFALDVFGGTMTIDEFRKSSGDKAPIVHMPNEIHILQDVVERHRDVGRPDGPSHGLLQDKLKEITQSTTKNEPLKLRRTKPLKRDQNNLETSMGIIVSKKN